MTRLIPPALVLGALLALPDVALGARTFTLGKGFAPNVAVGSDGTGHFAWHQPGGKIDKLRYCQVPRGKTACTRTRTWTGTGGVSYRNQRTFVFVTGQEVMLLATFKRPQAAPVHHDHLVYRSTDGGETFDDPYPIGDPDVGGAWDAGFDQRDFSTVTYDGTFTKTLKPGPPIRDSSPELGDAPQIDGGSYNGSLAMVGFKLPIVSLNDGRDRTVVFRFTGLPSNPTLASSWEASAAIPDETDAVLAPGPKGVYAMLLASPGDRCPCAYRFRRWGGSKLNKPFDSLQDFDGVKTTGGSHDLFQDANGRLHAVWAKADGQFARDPTDIRYARSTGGTADLGKPVSLAKRGRNTQPLDLRLGTASDGDGFVTWIEGTRESDNVVRAVAVSPGAKK